MGTGYTRNDTPNNIADGNVINASDLDGEFDAVQAAFNGSTGHSHDGTTGEGPQIDTSGLANGAVTSAKLDTNIQIAGTLGVTGVSSFANGSNSAPSLTFTSDTNTGIYRGGTDILKFVTAGTDAITINASQDVTLAGSVAVSDNEAIRFGAGQDLQLYHDASTGNSFVLEQGTGSLILQGTNIQLKATDSTSLAEFNDAGAVNLRYSGDLKLATTSTGIQVTGNIANTSGDLTLDVAGDIILDADGGDIKLSDSGTVFGELTNVSGYLRIKSPVSNADIEFVGNDGGSTITALTLDMSDAGSAYFNNNLYIPNYIYHSGDTNTYIHFPSDDNFQVVTAGYSRMKIVGSETSFNEDSADIDFRVESNNNANAFFVDASADKVQFGTNIGAATKIWFDNLESNDTYAYFGNNSSTTSNAPMFINRHASDGQLIQFRKASVSVGSIGSISGTGVSLISTTGTVQIGSSDAGLNFNGAGNYILPWNVGANTSNDGGVDLGASTHRFKNLYLSGGVYLGGTGSANYLDDYEEGTFDPEFLAATNPTVTYSTQTGVYTKIGRVVHFLIKLATDSVSGGSGTLRIGNLPFIPSHSTFSGTLTANAWTGERPMKFRLSASSVFLYYRTSIHTNDFDNNSQVSDLSTASGGNNITEVTGTYFTNS